MASAGRITCHFGNSPGPNVSANSATHQGTVKTAVALEGRGLHCGRTSKITIHPAQPGHGIVFRRLTKRGQATTLSACWRNVRRLPLCTCLSDGSRTQIRTVEHLLAAMFACGVDNAQIDVDGGEIPLLDGSAKPFIDAIMAAGVERQLLPRKIIRITKAIEINDGPRWVKVEPHEGFRIAAQTYFKPYGRLPWWEAEITRGFFSKEVAPARTYGLLVEGIAAKFGTWFMRDPICLGANIDNTLSVWRGRIVTPGGLRFPDEFSRHRVVDWVGDLMLAGADFRAKFTCFSPTHELARKALQAVFSEPNSHEVVDSDD